VPNNATRQPTVEEAQGRGELTSPEEKGKNYLHSMGYNKLLVSYMACVTPSA